MPEYILQIIFAFWGAEELGLFGSKHFVSSLGTQGEPKREDIVLDLNFDMVVSLAAQLRIWTYSNSYLYVCVVGSFPLHAAGNLICTVFTMHAQQFCQWLLSNIKELTIHHWIWPLFGVLIQTAKLLWTHVSHIPQCLPLAQWIFIECCQRSQLWWAHWKFVSTIYKIL